MGIVRYAVVDRATNIVLNLVLGTYEGSTEPEGCRFINVDGIPVDIGWLLNPDTVDFYNPNPLPDPVPTPEDNSVELYVEPVLSPIVAPPHEGGVTDAT